MKKIINAEKPQVLVDTLTQEAWERMCALLAAAERGTDGALFQDISELHTFVSHWRKDPSSRKRTIIAIDAAKLESVRYSLTDAMHDLDRLLDEHS